MRQLVIRLIPPRLRPFARRVYARRHGAAPVLMRAGVIAVLAVALVAAAVNGSWPVAIVGVVVALLIGGWEVRRRNAENQLMRSAITLLAARVDALPEIPQDVAPVVVRALLDRGDVLEAHALLSRQPSLAVVDVATRLRLRDGLYARGYLRSAITLAQSCAAAPWGGPHSRRLRRFEAEYRVLAGEAEPPRIVRPGDFSPVPGRVLHIVGTSLPMTQAGFTIRTHNIAVAQLGAGIEPHVVTQLGYGPRGKHPVQRAIDGVIYHHLPGPRRGSVPLDEWLAHNISSVAAVVAEVRPAVLHAASDFHNALTALALGDAFDLPVVYESRGFWEETLLSRLAHTYGWDLDSLATTHGLPDVYTLRRQIEDGCRRAADRVVTLADNMVDRIEAGGVDRGRITVVPNAVDVDAFPVQERNHALATRLGIDDEAIVLGYISSLVEYEGIDTLIEAYAMLREAGHSPMALLIVGDGVDRPRLMQRAADLNLPDVIFTGRVPHDEVIDYYSVIDIFVVPRRPVEVCHLVTPLKPFEAFATGRTVVMSDVRALAAIANDSGAARLFTAGSPQSLTDTLTALLADDGLRKELAAAGAAWVREHRTWAANARRYAHLYAEIEAETRR